MGNGSSIKNASRKKGVILVQTMRAEVRFKASIQHDKGCCSQEGAESKDILVEKEYRKRKSSNVNLQLDGENILQNKKPQTSVRKSNKVQKPATVRNSKLNNKLSGTVEKEKHQVGKSKKKIGEKETKSGVHKLSNAQKDKQGSELSQQIANVLHGAVNQKLPLNTKLIRIFISSTFTDTEQERNALMEKVYPKLKSYCHEHGYEFQVVDMRWGIRDEATDMHETIELCINEIRACQKLSIGPTFITLLAEKYGYCPLPPKIDAVDFDALVNAVPDDDIKDLFHSWYRMDHNEIPTSYVLQPVTRWYPDYFSKDNKARRDSSQQQWEEVFLRLKKALVKAVHNAFNDEEKIHLFIRSVSEAEIEEGLLKHDVNPNKCGWFHRKFSDLSVDEQELENNVMTRYIDTLSGTDDGIDTGQLLEEFRERIKQVLDDGNVVEYTVKWTGKGIDANSAEHIKYLETFCSDFENMLRAMIGKSIAEQKNSEIDSPLYAEVCQHALFCQAKIEMFCGRKTTLQNVFRYIESSCRSPLVLYGRSGCGKTSIMAMMAKEIQELTETNACVILRFIGTTPKSSSIRRLLKSVVQQIKSVYHLNFKIPRDTKGIIEAFSTVLSSATKHKPLVVLFDSLDQLSPDGGARQLSWLPKSLPDHVKLVVSTLPDKEFRCFPKLKAALKDPKLFIEVPNLPEQEVRDILTKWLKSKNRALQPDQLISIETAFKQCPLPLFLKISFDEACHWRSYMPLEQTRLQITIRDAINSLFERTERKHGELLVRRALGYLTAARSGLTANELEDILSCDDEVLDDVFQYWTPPIRRLPTLLWVRIRADLESYLVLKGAEGASVTYWYHRQFIEAAKARYLSEDLERIKIHSNIADYFMGYDVDEAGYNSGNTNFARLSSVSAQPLKLSRHRYNIRKLHELPYHLIVSQRWDHLKHEIFCNYVWLEAKIRARTLRAVLDDFRHVKEYHRDPDIETVGEILELGKDAILADPNQLASQLVSRIYDKKVQDTSSLMTSRLSSTLETLLRDAHHPEEPSLLPNRAFLDPPGGQLVKTLVGHKTGVYGLAATQDGEYLATGSQDGSVKIWCMSSGYLMTTVEDLGEDIGAIKCCDDDKRLVVSSKRGLTVLDFDTGEILQRLNTRFFDYPPPFTLAGKKGKTVVFFEEKGLQSINSMTRQLYFHIKDILPVGSAGHNSLLTSYGDTILCNSKEDENSLNVLDVQGHVSHCFVVFDSKDDEAFLNLTEIAMRKSSEVIVAKKHVVDLYDVQSGSKLKSIRCKLDDWIRYVSVVADSDILVFPKRNKVAILDLNTNERKDVLEHANYISRTSASAGNIIVTSGGDSVVRVWDLTRDDIHHQTEKPETVLKIYPLPTDPRHVIVVGRLGLNVHVITTWDLSTFLPISRVSNISSSYLKVINDRRAALRVDNHAVIIDIDNWKVVCVLKGEIPDFIYAGTPDLCLVNESKEILTYSLDQKSLQIYSIETGEKTGRLIGPRHQFKIQAFIVNSEGTVLAHNDEPLDIIFIWDVIKREVLFAINRTGYIRFLLTLAAFTPDGRSFVFSIRRTNEDDYIRHPSIWDVQKEKVIHDLRYPEDTDTRSLAVINNKSAVTSHKDYNIVIWDLITGTARYVLHTMYYGSRVDVLSSGGRYVVSHDDKTIILWDIQDGKQVGSFTADKLVTVQPLFDGDVIALGYESPLPVVFLRRQGRNLEPYQCPIEGTRAMGGGDMNVVFEGIKITNIAEEQDEK